MNKGKQDVRGRSKVVEGRLKSRVGGGGKDRKVGIRDEPSRTNFEEKEVSVVRGEM